MALLAAGCSGTGGAGSASRPAEPPPEPVRTDATTAPITRPRIVALGDSLTEGLGLGKTEAYPADLQRRLDAAGYAYEVVNAGVSGDTSAGGLRRFDWCMEGDVRILIVALGGNDGLRGLPVPEMEHNLAAIIERARQRHVTVLLTGMETLTNMGPDYQRAFHDVFPRLAQRYRVAFLPFLLEGVAGHRDLNQPDGIHPTAEGARIVAAHLWTVLEPMLGAAQR